MRKCRPWPYEELVHAVMMMRAPGLPAGKRIKSFVQSVDVAPTVCEWLGIGVHPDMQGKSLLALARGEVDKVRDFAIAGYYRYSWSIITDEWSYIHWIKEDEKSVAESMFEMYGKGTLASSSHLVDNPLAKAGPQMNEEQRKAKNAAAATGYGEGVARSGRRRSVDLHARLHRRGSCPRRTLQPYRRYRPAEQRCVQASRSCRQNCSRSSVCS